MPSGPPAHHPPVPPAGQPRKPHTHQPSAQRGHSVHSLLRPNPQGGGCKSKAKKEGISYQRAIRMPTGAGGAAGAARPPPAHMAARAIAQMQGLQKSISRGLCLCNRDKGTTGSQEGPPRVPRMACQCDESGGELGCRDFSSAEGPAGDGGRAWTGHGAGARRRAAAWGPGARASAPRALRRCPPPRARLVQSRRERLTLWRPREVW